MTTVAGDFPDSPLVTTYDENIQVKSLKGNMSVHNVST